MTYAEDLAELRHILVPGRYHAVVGNPPYITPKDRALNQAYRDRYGACHMKYSLAVPFMERIFRLAVEGGFTGQITANSFMKREFGKKLIEQFLPTVDLMYVVDTSGAYIPGHGTPTVILFGRHRKPVADTIRTVMGIRGEPSTPDEPAHGVVWSAIVNQVDQPGSQSEFVSVADMPRDSFAKHPWSIGGGGAAELKDRLEEARERCLSDIADAGVAVVTLEDEAFQMDGTTAWRTAIPKAFLRGFVVGDTIRDWQLNGVGPAIFPHDAESFAPVGDPVVVRRLWPLRTCLTNRLWFRKTMPQRGMEWYAYGHISAEKFRTPLSIAYGEVATHNHFVLDRGGKVFKQTAPVIKLSAEASEDDHLALLGLLNSSTGCFWLKQVCHNKGSTVDQHGARQRTNPFEDFFAFNATKLEQFPLPPDRPLIHARLLDGISQSARGLLPASVVKLGVPTRRAWELAQRMHQLANEQMVAGQEELDWSCYRLYGLIDEDLVYRTGVLPPIALGQRAFEIVLARKMAAGELQTTWFERHGSTPITELPADWPEAYRQLVERRIELIATNPQIALIEQPEYKRRWNAVPWEQQAGEALREWLLDRLESYFDFDGRMNEAGNITAKLDIAFTSTARLADVARQDVDFMQVAELYRDDPAFDVQSLVAELVERESVPLLPVLRYKPSGLRKRAEWERTWQFQRQEDAIDARAKLADADPQRLTDDEARELKRRQIGAITVPPKYTSADFLKSDYWRLRGKLDVPKERWINFPHCEGPDGTLVIAWAGYDRLQLARSISAYHVDVQERLGGRDDPRLVPLLACLIELLPWLKQWHNEPDSQFDGMRMGDYFEGFVQEEARQLGKTLDEIKAWQPPAGRSRSRRRSRL